MENSAGQAWKFRAAKNFNSPDHRFSLRVCDVDVVLLVPVLASTICLLSGSCACKNAPNGGDVSAKLSVLTAHCCHNFASGTGGRHAVPQSSRIRLIVK